jgi:hypothetical protein
VIARPQARITNGHDHKKEGCNAHLLQPRWLPHGEADQRRTMDSATPRDASRRLIQHLVLPATPSAERGATRPLRSGVHHLR